MQGFACIFGRRLIRRGQGRLLYRAIAYFRDSTSPELSSIPVTALRVAKRSLRVQARTYRAFDRVLLVRPSLQWKASLLLQPPNKLVDHKQPTKEERTSKPPDSNKIR